MADSVMIGNAIGARKKRVKYARVDVPLLWDNGTPLLWNSGDPMIAGTKKIIIKDE